MDRAERRKVANEIAELQDGVVSRQQLSGLGITRHHVRREVERGAWALHGRHTVALHTGPVSAPAHRWRAAWETGVEIAAIDGVTALQHAGLAGFEDPVVHVSAVHNHNTETLHGARVHKVIRRTAGELMPAGLPRTRPEVAAVRAAHWAASDRQAALVLLMVVQQRLTTPLRLAAAERAVRGRNRRPSSGRWCVTSSSGCRVWESWTSPASAAGGTCPSRLGRWCARPHTGASISTSPGRATCWSWRSTGSTPGWAST